MASTEERIGIVETKVENINEKIDELKVDVKDMHDCLDKTRDLIKEELEKMYDSSCTQHELLAKEISGLKKLKDKWTWMIAGGIGFGGWIAGNSEHLLKLLH